MKNYLPVSQGDLTPGGLFRNPQYIASENNPDHLAASAAEIAFVGRSNVGKSSFVNALCRKQVALVSGTPGRTRTINVYSVGPDRWLVDLPGYGYAKGPREEREKWGPMIESYLLGRPNLRMIYLLIDAKVGPTKMDLEMVDWLKTKGLHWRAVATKSDQVKPSYAAAQRKEIAGKLGLEPQGLSWICAKSNLGITELRAETASLLA